LTQPSTYGRRIRKITTPIELVEKRNSRSTTNITPRVRRGKPQGIVNNNLCSQANTNNPQSCNWASQVVDINPLVELLYCCYIVVHFFWSFAFGQLYLTVKQLSQSGSLFFYVFCFWIVDFTMLNNSQSCGALYYVTIKDHLEMLFNSLYNTLGELSVWV